MPRAPAQETSCQNRRARNFFRRRHMPNRCATGRARCVNSNAVFGAQPCSCKCRALPQADRPSATGTGTAGKGSNPSDPTKIELRARSLSSSRNGQSGARTGNKERKDDERDPLWIVRLCCPGMCSLQFKGAKRTQLRRSRTCRNPPCRKLWRSASVHRAWHQQFNRRGVRLKRDRHVDDHGDVPLWDYMPCRNGPGF